MSDDVGGDFITTSFLAQWSRALVNGGSDRHPILIPALVQCISCQWLISNL